MGASARLFVVARNPDAASRLPYLVRVPLPGRDLVLKAREPWPRTGAVYCHPADGEWPDPPASAEILGAPEGIERLGGVDFDEAILSYVDDAVRALAPGAARELVDLVGRLAAGHGVRPHRPGRLVRGEVHAVRDPR